MEILLDALDKNDRDILHGRTPIVLLVGTPRSGKTSIVDTVLGHQSPSTTLFIEPTLKPKLTRVNIGKLFEFAVVEMPTHYFTGAPSSDEFDSFLFRRASTLWVVLDSHQVAQIDDRSEVDPISQLTTCEEIGFCRDLILRAKRIHPSICVDVFVHKMDGAKFRTLETRSTFQSLVCSALMEALDPESNQNVMLFSTSIYDYSIREATGHLVQRLIPQIDIVSSLLDVLVKNCQAQQAFILDIRTGLFVGMDSNGFDPICYELCSDMLDIVQTSACLRNKTCTDSSPLDSCSVSMDNGFTIQLRGIDQAISLGLVMKEDTFDVQHLVDVNVIIFTEALQKSISLFNEFTGKKEAQAG